MKEKKLKSIITKYSIWILGLAITVLSYVFEKSLFEETSVFNKAISESSLINSVYQALPKIILTIRIIFIAALCKAFIDYLSGKNFGHNKKNVTIIKLLFNFMKWIVIIITVFMILSGWGVDTGTLLASAGILGLVIGLGAQSLISDIIAGIFIVFEGEYSVGDIIIVDDWRGTVLEIGIRTTKIVDAGGNVKIINNSEIKSIINQTQELSLAKCVIGIEYSESIPKVELIIRDNLETIRKNIPSIKEGPYYKGITSLSASSVDILIVAKCDEEEIYQVQRDLNREMKLLFDKNGINIPFPQVTVSQLEVKNEQPTKREINAANDFRNEQNQITKDIKVDKVDNI